MKFSFKIQQYQTDAVDAVARVFQGQPYNAGVSYLRDMGNLSAQPQQLSLVSNGDDATQVELQDLVNDSGFKNEALQLTDQELLQNIRALQAEANIHQSDKLVAPLGRCSLDIEMETGTGKTYVYIKTMFELNKRYGWSKFIVVVPSIAIREGVKKSFEITADHFMECYGKKARFFIYNSSNLNQLDSFSSNSGINVMIINTQAFAASMNEDKNVEGRKGDAAPEFAAMIPMQVYNSLQVPAEKECLKQVRHLIIGGGAIDSTLATELASFPHAVWSTYGMTETLSHIALRRLNGPDASNWYTPFQGVKVSLSPENTLTIEAPAVCAEELTTNDICEFNAQGQFHILGRKDNTVNTGGVKVQIEQVENALKTALPVPFMVTAVPDPKFGECIVLLLESEENTDVSPLLAQAYDQLPTYWRPKQTFFVRHLPQTETGKPDRATARKVAQEIASAKKK